MTWPQDRLIDYMRRMHETHTCEEVMLKMERWISEHRQDSKRSRHVWGGLGSGWGGWGRWGAGAELVCWERRAAAGASNWWAGSAGGAGWKVWGAAGGELGLVRRAPWAGWAGFGWVGVWACVAQVA